MTGTHNRVPNFCGFAHLLFRSLVANGQFGRRGARNDLLRQVPREWYAVLSVWLSNRFHVRSLNMTAHPIAPDRDAGTPVGQAIPLVTPWRARTQTCKSIEVRKCIEAALYEYMPVSPARH